MNAIGIGHPHLQAPSKMLLAAAKVVVDGHGNLIGALVQRQVE